MELTLTLSIDLALGNGTRKRGVPLAVFTIPEDAEPSQIVSEAWAGSLFGSPVVSAGVTEREVLTALRSPYCVLTGGREAAVEPRETDAGVDGDAGAWRKAYVARMYFGTDTERIRRTLRKAGLKTAGDIDREGNDHRGLTHIDGVTADDEKTIAATMRGLIMK